MKQFKLRSGFDKKCSNALYLFSTEKELNAIKSIPSYQKDIISKDKEKKEFIFQNEEGLTVLFKTGESLEQFRKSGFSFYNYASAANVINWNIHFTSGEEYNFAFLEGFALSAYSFEKYKSEKKAKKFEVNTGESLSKSAIQELENVVDATCIARTLVN